MKSPTSALSSMLDVQSPTFVKQKLPFAWPSIPSIIVPHRLRRKVRSRLRSGQSKASSISQLQTSFAPRDTLRSLSRHRWTVYDGQYLFLIFTGIFALSVIEFPGPIIKASIASLLITSLILPATRQFFLPFIPIATYLVLFYSCGFIPAEWRMPIWVRVLPALENIVYGANLSNILSKHTNVVLDVLAWIPYGIIHFGGPFVCAAVLFVFGPPGFLPVWSYTFGWLNVIGVYIQLLFPCSAPWYENKYGLAPANYSMHGSPGGLARIDELFGGDTYTKGFTGSPVVFGAFPSLHAATATCNALFLSVIFPRARPFLVGYVLWIWWATMYLTHHYFVDLIGGSTLAVACFYIAKKNWLPRVQPGKDFRWDYDYVQCGEESKHDADYAYGLSNLDLEYYRHGADSDEWTVGSSSESASSGSLSPIDDHRNLWEEDTLTGRESDSDTLEVVIDDRR